MIIKERLWNFENLLKKTCKNLSLATGQSLATITWLVSNSCKQNSFYALQFMKNI